MKIRPYVASDLEAAVHLFTASVHELAQPCYGAGQLPAWAPLQPDWAAWQLLLCHQHTWLAVQGSALHGLIAWDQQGHIALLNTALARRGVASALYQSAETSLQQQGVRALFTAASLAARPFFEHHGFATQAEETVERRGALLRRLVMGKRLPPASGTDTLASPAM